MRRRPERVAERLAQVAQCAVVHEPPSALARPVILTSAAAGGSGRREDDGVAPGMFTKLKVKVLYGSLLEETMSRRQLHEAERGVVCDGRGNFAVGRNLSDVDPGSQRPRGRPRGRVGWKP